MDEPITLTLVKKYIAKALIDDQDLKDFAENNFGKDLNIFCGIDYNNPPSEDDSPFLSLHSHSHTGMGEDDSIESFGLVIGASIYNEEIVVDESVPGLKVSTYTGVEQIEELMYLANEALKTLPHQLQFNSQSLDHDDTFLYPNFDGILEVSVSSPKTMGGFKACLPSL